MTITTISPQGRRATHSAAELLTPALRDAVRVEANRWIKQLRLVHYGGVTMRERFTYREDSLWWFTEIYLHRMRQLDAALETVFALDAARDAGASALVVEATNAAVLGAARAFGRARGVPVETAGIPDRPDHGPAGWLALAAQLSRLRVRPRPSPSRPPAAAAFVHSAFWRTDDPAGETYVGSVLDALVSETSRDDIAFVGVGPRRNFRVRRWWDPLMAGAAPSSAVTPIEQFAPAGALKASRHLWRERRRLSAELTAGAGIREAAVVRGCDLWPVLEHELRAVAEVQWPWSARSMDEAGAALDVLAPRVVVTYAEAGGWGRALMLEARRRGIRSVGLQHGFIYRHWLNYLHEPDEMRPIGGDRGFPRPDRTLLYDRIAADHLETAGHFPASSLSVTGSARLEDLIGRLAALRPQRDDIRRRHGVGPDAYLAVLAAKFTEIRDVLPSLVDGAARLEDLRLMIKTHPAEAPGLYGPFVSARERVTVAPAGADLAELFAAADLIITMNSTVAIDGLVLGVPALVVGLPNNLSPFVDAGVMLGADGAENIQRALESVLYDRRVRAALAERASAFAGRHALAPEPGAAARAARTILDKDH